MSPRRTAVAAALSGLLPLLAACGGSHSTSYGSGSAGAETISDGWVSTVAGAMSGMAVSSMPSIAGEDSAAYATVHNNGSQADAVVSVTTSAAGSVTLHNTRSSGGGTAGTMVAVPTVPVPAHGTVTLAPGGYHVMLMKLHASFAVGSTITMTWRFRSGAAVTATFPVIDPADRPEESGS